jgi:CDP-diacylglycerol--glycerol-3-phosphate 3-phosphatidyltransferase
MPFTIANLLSLFRIAAAPFLLFVAYLGMERGFYILFALMLVSDALDGIIARALNQTSELGSKLDSYGDILTYFTAPLAIWWLFPEVIEKEKSYIFAAITIFVLPALFALVKFGKLASYHTWITKVSAVLMSFGVAVLVLFKSPDLFHIAVFFLIVEAVENIAITLILPMPKTDVRSFWHVLRSK